MAFTISRRSQLLGASKNMRTVLVTSLGSVAGDVVTKSLKSYGCRVVGCDIYPKEWVVDSFSVDVFYRIPRVDASEEYLACLRELCARERVDFIIPLIDPEVDLLNVNRKWFNEHGVTLCISPKTALDVIRDKKKLADFIEANCPRTKSIKTEYLRELSSMPDWGFPLVCKPCNGRSSQGLRYVNSQAEWDALLEVADMETYIVEPFIEGPIVMVEVVRNPEQGITVAMTREELLSTPHCLALTVRTYRDERLEEASIELAEKLGVKGNVNFEYLRSPDGVHHFVECNPRFSAGSEFSVMSGYDLVINSLRCFEGKGIESFAFDHPRVIARKYEEYVMEIQMDDAVG